MTDSETFDPLEAYSLDDLCRAIDSRCFSMFVVCIPRRQVGDGGNGTDVFKSIQWHDYRVLELIGAVGIAERDLHDLASESSGPTKQPKDDS